MTFVEMREKYDKANAFSDFVTVDYAETIELLPTEFHNMFPKHCACGSEMLINYAKTKITCCDPRCHIKQALALSELFRRFNIKGISDATCTDVYRMLHRLDSERIASGLDSLFVSDSYVEILLLDREIYPVSFKQSAIGLVFLDGIDTMKSRVLTFPQMVSLLGLPEFDSTAYKLFDDINSATELISIIKNEGGVENFCNNRGVYAPLKKFWLQASLTDIAVGDHIFYNNIRMTGLKVMDICITGSIYYKGSKLTKNDFISFCNRECSARPIEEILEDVFLDVDEIQRDTLEQIGTILNGNIIPKDVQGNIFKARDVLEYVSSCQIPCIQVYEVKMTTAKKSVPYIIADRPSNSSKYLEGQRRGEIYDEDGTKHRVLCTSEEFIETIKSKISKWEGELIKECRQKLTKVQKMECF